MASSLSKQAGVVIIREKKKYIYMPYSRRNFSHPWTRSSQARKDMDADNTLPRQDSTSAGENNGGTRF